MVLPSIAVEGAVGNPERRADVGDGVVGAGFHRSGQGDLLLGKRWLAPSPAIPGSGPLRFPPGALHLRLALRSACQLTS